MSINQHSFYLKSGEEHLACTALVPEQASGAVLMLPPFVEERKGAIPFMLSVARSLYSLNTASLIFDWRGSGDSTGQFESIKPDDFSTDFETVLKWLKQNPGDIPITALGIRLSATFLLHFNHPDIKQLVLVSPTSGNEFIRQLLQRRMVNDMVAYGKAIESRSSLLGKLKSGESVDLDGYIFTSQFYKYILKNTGIRDSGYGIQDNKFEHPTSNIQHPTSNQDNPHTLLIPGGHDRKTAKEIAETLNNVEATELRFPPFWNTVGHVDLSEVVDCVTEWICEKGAVQVADNCCSRGQQTPEVELTLSETAENCNVEIDASMPSMRLIDIPSADSIIRAALNSPKGTPKAGVLFLAGWSGDRTGPHRIFVQFARKFTDEGYLCLRPDFRGRGLSDGNHTDASISSMADDADVALSELKQQLPDDVPVYIAAICSGCKVAITLASKHPEIQKMLLLSAESMGSLRSEKTDSNKTKNALMTYVKKLTQPETWKKILTGKVQTKMVTKALVKHETRSDDEAIAEDVTLKEFENFSNPVHFVFGGSDPDAPGSMNAYDDFCKKHGIPHSMHLVPNAGHSYYSVKWTKEVFESGLGFLK